MTEADARRRRWRRRGIALESVTLAWNVVGVAVLAVAATSARSTALVGFGADSLIEIGASTVVLWDLRGSVGRRRRRALALIAAAFAALSAYLVVQGVAVLATGHRARPSDVGIAWTAATVLVMVVLAAGKRRAGEETENPVMAAEAGVTAVDAAVAVVVLAGTALDGALGWWWADPVAGLAVGAYAAREALVHRRELAGR